MPIVIEGECFVSRYTLIPARREEFLQIFDALWRGVEALMEGATHFVFYGWSRKGEFVAIESWKDPAVVAAFRKTDDFKQVVSSLLDCCSEHMVMEAFGGIEGGTEVFDLHSAGKSTVHPESSGIAAVYI